MRPRASFAASCFALAIAAPLGAQTLEVQSGTPVRVEIVHVDALVEEGIARVEVDETFRNTSGAVQEGVYRFKLPQDAVIGAFSMWMEGREQQGRVVEAKQARATYDAIVRKKRDPGLLEQVGWREFRVNVFPIPARDTVRVKLVYSHVVRDDLGLETLEIPLPRGAGAIGDLRVRVAVRSARGLAGLDCPSHPTASLATCEEGGDASWSGDGVEPTGAFVLRAIPRRTGFDVMLLADRESASSSGWFIARIVPRLESPPAIGRDLVFVVDRSGSMEGKKLEQARAALLAGLATLRAGDRFDVVSFSTDVTALGDGRLLDATRENLERARRAAHDLTASGGTNIRDALLAAAKPLEPDPRRFAAIVFLTDGAPTVGETNPDRILADWHQERGTTRLFAFGVGNDVKDFLLTKLASAGRGDARYVAEDENLEVPLASLFERMKRPLLLDPSIDVDGGDTAILDREPRQLADLFQGRALLVCGRYEGAGKATLHLRGRAGDDEVQVDVPIELPAATPRRPHVAQIWAKARVERLLDDLRALGPNEEIRAEVQALGLKHQLVTPYTSFLVLEPERKLAGVPTSDTSDAPRDADEGTKFDRTPDSGTITSGAGGFLQGRTKGQSSSSGAAAGPTTPGSSSPSSGGAGGGGVRMSTGGLGMRRGSSEGYERWEFWWEHNKDRFLVQTEGSDADDSAAHQPDPALARDVVPALIAALRDPAADVADSAAIALGRMRHEGDTGAVRGALTIALGHREKTVREAATLALGSLGSEQAIGALRELLQDSERGRQLTKQSAVEPLVRAFAAASLGMIGSEASIEDLEKVLAASDAAGSRDVNSMALLALGMVRATDESAPGIVRTLVEVLGDATQDELVRAQAPIALGRLARGSAPGAAAVRRALPSLLPLFTDTKLAPNLRRSIAIALGCIASVDDDVVIAALVEASEAAGDEPTRHFSILALAEIGARDPVPAKQAAAHAQLQRFLLGQLQQPRRLTHVPHAALALGIYARNPALPVEAKAKVAAALLDQFRGTSNPSYGAAIALALGLLEETSAAPAMRARLDETGDAPLAGYLALALSLAHSTTDAGQLRRRLSASLDRRERVQLYAADGLLRDRQAVSRLLDAVQHAPTLAEAAAAAGALGRIRDPTTIEPLLALLRDPTNSPLQRGFAAAALGAIGEKTALPWNAAFSADANYRAKGSALAEIIDLF